VLPDIIIEEKMIKNSQYIKHLTQEITGHLLVMESLGKDNHVITNVVRSGLDLMTVIKYELEKQ
jgi:hypothetical protein